MRDMNTVRAKGGFGIGSRLESQRANDLGAVEPEMAELV